MSEWLTTGQMIDRLKVGEIAEDKNGDKIFIEKDGSLRTLPNHQIVTMSDYTMLSKWRILPKYVTFSEAMKAIEEGKNVICHFEDYEISVESLNKKVGAICKRGACQIGGAVELKLAWINYGKWVIVEESK